MRAGHAVFKKPAEIVTKLVTNEGTKNLDANRDAWQAKMHEMKFERTKTLKHRRF